MDLKKYIKFITALIDQNKFVEATKVANSFLKDHPECVYATYLSDLFLQNDPKSKDPKLKEKAYEICIKNDVDYPSAYINIIRTMINENKLTEAFELINRAKTKFPNNDLVYIESSKLYQIIKNIELVIKLTPKSESAHCEYGLLLNKLFNLSTDEEEFEEYYRRTLIQYMIVLSINMHNVVILCNYGTVIARYANKYYTKANTLSAQSKQLITENKIAESKTLKEKANLYYMYATQYYLEADTKFLQALDINPADYETQFNIDLLSKSLNDIEKAIKINMK